MKYCKRCFRNISSEHTVCPFCHKSDKLIDYSSESSGERFECTGAESKDLKTKDVYYNEDDDEIAYGETDYDKAVKREMSMEEGRPLDISGHYTENTANAEPDVQTASQKKSTIVEKVKLDTRNMTEDQRRKYIQDLIEQKKRAQGFSTTTRPEANPLDTFPEEKKPLIMPVWGKVLYFCFTLENFVVSIICFAIFSSIFKEDSSFKILGIMTLVISFFMNAMMLGGLING